jgi:hypothetical protein
MMWEIIYADGRANEFESNLMWRAADLLGISSRERIELGQRVASRRVTDSCRAYDHDVLPFGGRVLADVPADAPNPTPKSNDDELGVRCLLVSSFCPSSAIASREPALDVCSGCAAWCAQSCRLMLSPRIILAGPAKNSGTVYWTSSGIRSLCANSSNR